MAKISNKREKLVDAAKTLIHEQGLRQTTLANVAEYSHVPLGNVYYYFKTWDALTKAVIASHHADMMVMQDHCDTFPTPKERILCVIDILWKNWVESAAVYGCPVGSLCSELNKSESPLRNQADDILSRQVDWLEGQFEALKHANPRDMAVYFMSAIQGAALLANSLKDRKLLTNQLTQLEIWVKSL